MGTVGVIHLMQYAGGQLDIMWLIGTPGTWCYRTDLVASGFMTDAQPSLCSTPQPQPSAPLKEVLAPRPWIGMAQPVESSRTWILQVKAGGRRRPLPASPRFRPSIRHSDELGRTGRTMKNPAALPI